MDNKELSGIQQLVEIHFDFASTEEESEVYRLKMAEYLQYLLDNHFERLVQGMYRIDVDEALFRKTLATGNALDLADLIIERERRKVYFRMKYSS